MTNQYSIRISDENEQIITKLREKHPALMFVSKAAVINYCIEYVAYKLNKGEEGGYLKNILKEINKQNKPESDVEDRPIFDSDIDSNFIL